MAEYTIIRNPDFTDLDLTMTKSRRNRDLSQLVGIDAIQNSVLNLINYNFREVPFQPTKGSGVRKLLFDNINHLTSMYIADKITQVITNFEPRVQLQTVTVDPVPDGYGYEVSIKYTVNNILGSLEINTFLTRIR